MWAVYNIGRPEPDDIVGIAICPLCVDHGIFNRQLHVLIGMGGRGAQDAKSTELARWLDSQGIPWRERLVERTPHKKELFPLPSDYQAKYLIDFYPRNTPEFLADLSRRIS